MQAELCQLMGRAFDSPYWNYASSKLETGGRPPRGWMIDQGLKAVTLDKLPENLQTFLKLCDQSNEIWWELFQGKPSGMEPEQEQDMAIATMIQRGIIPPPDDDEDIEEDDIEEEDDDD